MFHLKSVSVRGYGQFLIHWKKYVCCLWCGDTHTNTQLYINTILIRCPSWRHRPSWHHRNGEDHRNGQSQDLHRCRVYPGEKLTGCGEGIRLIRHSGDRAFNLWVLSDLPSSHCMASYCLYM